MKWALVLALVLCCGLAKGDTENDNIESFDKLTKQLAQDFLISARSSDDETPCTKECSKDNEECYFDDGGEAQCRCIKKFSRKGDECVACNTDCGENGECYFDDGDAEKCRCVEKFEKDVDTCKPCDCGTNGTCSFDSSQPVCTCNTQNEVKNGKCAYCNCGEKGKCSFDGEDRVCLCNDGYAEDKDTTGECKACECGETTSTGCEFTGDKKICKCKDNNSQKGNTCEACECGETTSAGCEFTGDKKICKCKDGNSQKGNTCEACTKGCSKESEECYFDDGGEAQCRCTQKFSRKGDECVACNTDCKENEECYFDENDAEAEKCRCVEKFEKDVDTCKPCDCGTNGTCSFDDSSQPVCTCNTQNEMKNGKCAYCYCGEKGKCSFDGENRVCSCNDWYAEDKDTTGECKACDCGATTSTGCEFTGGEKICKCKDKNSQKGNTCEECDCGDESKIKNCTFNELGAKVCDCAPMNADLNGKCTDCGCGEMTSTGCIFLNDTAICSCKDGNSQKGKICEACNCGEKGNCSFDGENKVCSCEEGYAEDKDKTGECKECDCGDKTKKNGCAFNKEGEKVCDCVSMYADKNGTCTACDCGTNGTCSFDDKGQQVCKCKEKNKVKNGKCAFCYCGEKGKCSFNGDNKVCSCDQGYLEDKDITGECKACDCGTNGTCSFDDKGQQKCKCKEKNEEKNGKCEFCYCGEKGKCSFNGDNKVCLCDEGYAEDKDTTGECKECDCGKNGKCSFENKNKTCSCNKGYKEKGGTCIECDCKGNGTCSFNETGAIICECDKGFAKMKDGLCHPCDCKGNGTCSFNETGVITCKCDQGFAKMKDGLCYPCDCGEHGTCSLDDNGKKNCACNAKFADKKGTCVDCECGEEAKSCQFTNDVKTCNCNSKYADKDGTCSECNCGEITTEAKSCKFNKGVKECDCVSLYAPKDGTCTDCDCGNTTVVEGCEFKDDETICKCKKNFSQKDESCEVCDCGKNGKCSFVNGVKTCACNDRYKDDQGTCKMCDCGENGECLFINHEKECDCEEGFEEWNGKCEECDCGADGTCSFVDKKKNCTCDDGSLDYNGTCTKPCKTNGDCKSQTICKATKWGSFCDCKKIFSGHKCENVVACETGDLKDCQKTGGKCSYNFTQNKAVCECDEERKFDENKNFKICRYKCKPEEATCKNGAKCQDELCVCLTGTSGDDCSIVDVCDTDFKAKCEKISAKCVYDITTKSATCQCSNKDMEYKDDKCTPKWCDPNPCKAKVSVCVYGFRSAFCKCTESGKYYDYATNNCIAIDKCPLVPCKKNEICTDDGKCACDENYVKENDECEKKKLCDSTPCSKNATCEEAIGTVKCECPNHTYFSNKSKACEVMIKEEEKCKDGKDCGPFGYCVKKGDAFECACKKGLAVLDKDTGVCILNGKEACLSKKILSNNNKKCDCNGMFKVSTNGITCEYLTCGDEAAQKDCESKGAYCVDTKDSNKKLKSYECKCSDGQTLTTDKGCVDACSDKAMLEECSKKQQTCYLQENGFATCECPPGFTANKTDETCQLNVQFTYLLKGLPVMAKEFLNKDQSVNKVKLNQYVIKSMKAVSSKSYEFASVQNFRISDDVILCDVWLKFIQDAEQDVKRWRSQVVITNDSIVLPPSLKLSSVELDQVKYEKVEFCSPIVYQTVCGRQGSKCDNNACSCMDGYDVVGTTVQVIDGNTVMRCEDIDECKENKHSCNANSECMNTIGGHYCKCKPGFHKKDQNESEECVELCSSNPCNNGDCAVNEKENRVECSCKAGFKGSYCTESDDKLKQAQHSTKVVGAVLGTILAVTFVAIIAYVVKLKKNSYSEDFSTSPRDNSEMAERPQRGISNRGYQ